MPVTRWRDPDGRDKKTVGGTVVGGLQIGPTTKMGRAYRNEVTPPTGASAEAQRFAEAVGKATEGLVEPPSSPVEAPLSGEAPEVHPFACDVCEVTAKSAAGLAAHKRSHR